MEVGDRFWKLGIEFSLVGHLFQDVLRKCFRVLLENQYYRLKALS
jgi:hypothetical protein